MKKIFEMILIEFQAVAQDAVQMNLRIRITQNVWERIAIFLKIDVLKIKHYCE